MGLASAVEGNGARGSVVSALMEMARFQRALGLEGTPESGSALECHPKHPIVMIAAFFRQSAPVVARVMHIRPEDRSYGKPRWGGAHFGITLNR
jgi:hypothetical protein